MKKRVLKILEHFNLEKIKNDRRVVVFAVCLFIATALWFLNALGKNYTTSLFYSVKYINPPEDLFLTSSPPSRFELKVEAHGFTLLRHKLALSTSPIILNLNTLRQNSESNGGVISIRTQSLIPRISDQVSNEITISDINPQTITLFFDSLTTKSLPVKPDLNIQFKPQYYRKGAIRINPEHLKISGPSSLLDTMSFLSTEKISLNDLSAYIEKRVRVNHPENTRISQETVLVEIPVEQFTEKTFKVPVQVKNEPSGVSIKLFPSEVNVSFLVGLSEYENVTPADFKTLVDYQQADYDSETLDISVEEQPPFIQMLRIMPQEVDFLIEEQN